MGAGDSGPPGPTVPGHVELVHSQQSENVTTPSESLNWDQFTKKIGTVSCAVLHESSLFLVLTGQSLEVSTAPGNGSVTGRATQNPVRSRGQRFERCSAASLTLCLITMICTCGFLYQIHVSIKKIKNICMRLHIMTNRGRQSPWKSVFMYLWYTERTI